MNTINIYGYTFTEEELYNKLEEECITLEELRYDLLVKRCSEYGLTEAMVDCNRDYYSMLMDFKAVYTDDIPMDDNAAETICELLSYPIKLCRKDIEDILEVDLQYSNLIYAHDALPTIEAQNSDFKNGKIYLPFNKHKTPADFDEDYFDAAIYSVLFIEISPDCFIPAVGYDMSDIELLTDIGIFAIDGNAAYNEVSIDYGNEHENDIFYYAHCFIVNTSFNNSHYKRDLHTFINLSSKYDKIVSRLIDWTEEELIDAAATMGITENYANSIELLNIVTEHLLKEHGFII